MIDQHALREQMARAIFDAACAFNGKPPISDTDWRVYWSPGGPVAMPSLLAVRADAALDALAAALKAAGACMLPDGTFSTVAAVQTLGKFAPFPEAVKFITATSDKDAIPQADDGRRFASLPDAEMEIRDDGQIAPRSIKTVGSGIPGDPLKFIGPDGSEWHVEFLPGKIRWRKFER